jgi:formylglycine-generating enzyme required for sulfatase activity
MKKLILIVILVTTAIFQIHSREGKRIGKIGEVKRRGKIIVTGQLIGKKVAMGTTLYVRVKGKIIKMKADFPMGSLVKCTLHRKYRKYAKYIKKGNLVYIYRKGLDKKKDNNQGVAGETKKFGGIEFVYVKGGTFQMGSNVSNDEKPIHKVKVSSFWMGKYEVTQKQYEDIIDNNPSYFKKKWFGRSNNHPVEKVSWYDAVEFCNALSRKVGRKPYYRINKKKKDPNNTRKYDDKKWIIKINKKANGFRLPYEAEWEYAARAGTTTKYYWGDRSDSESVDKYAVYRNNSWDKGESSFKYGTHRVGTKKSNQYGLYDMSGNIREWCYDWYDKNYYKNSPKRNPKGASGGSYRVSRGGGWKNRIGDLRLANRIYRFPDGRISYLGFRLLLEK